MVFRGVNLESHEIIKYIEVIGLKFYKNEEIKSAIEDRLRCLSVGLCK